MIRTSTKPRANCLATIALLGLMLFVMGCAAATSQTEATATPIPPAERPRNPTYEVTRGEVVDQVQFSGRIAPVVEKALSFGMDGRIRGIYVERNEFATTGQLLAELEVVEDLKRQLSLDELALRKAQVNVSMAELALKMAKDQAAFSDDEIALAEANLEAARALLDTAVGAESSAGNLLTMGQINLEQAQSELAHAQEAYDKAWDPGRDWELDIDYRKEALENERADTSHRLEQAQRDLRTAQANLNFTAGGLSNDSSASAQAALVSAEMAVGPGAGRLRRL